MPKKSKKKNENTQCQNPVAGPGCLPITPCQPVVMPHVNEILHGLPTSLVYNMELEGKRVSPYRVLEEWLGVRLGLHNAT